MREITAVFALVLALLIAACRMPPPPPSLAPPAPVTDADLLARPVACPANVPAALAPPEGTTLLFALDAWGEQDYDCEASAWTLRTPRADLYVIPPFAHMVMHHFVGPAWQFTIDSSMVIGAKTASATPDPTAIPWLLLQVTKHIGATDGLLSRVSWIQRMSTGGGLAPDPATCTATGPTASGVSGYHARYFFYGPQDPTKPAQRCGAQ